MTHPHHIHGEGRHLYQAVATQSGEEATTLCMADREQAIMHQPLGCVPFAAIDFESAGAAPGETDHPVQIGIIRVDTLLWEQQQSDPLLFDSYIACPHSVRWSAAQVHGITTDKLRGAPQLIDLWQPVRDLLRGAVIVGHNPSTEQRHLRAFPGHGFGPWLDTLALARRALPGQPDYALGSICDVMGLTPLVDTLVPRRWHDALYDAAASLLLLRALIQGLGMESYPLETLDFAVKQG